MPAARDIWQARTSDTNTPLSDAFYALKVAWQGVVISGQWPVVSKNKSVLLLTYHRPLTTDRYFSSFASGFCRACAGAACGHGRHGI
jgi:hypothetical protein